MPVFGCDSDDITINVTTDGPDFASLVPCTATTATININAADGGVTSSVCLATSGAPIRGRVRIAGNQGGGPPGTVFVTLSSNVTINSGGDNMNVTGLSLNPGGGTTATFNAKNTETFDIGGTLNVGANQPGGTYSGSFVITAICP